MKTPHKFSLKNWLLVILLKSDNQDSSKDKGYVLVVVIAIILGISGLLALYAKTSKVEQNSTTAVVDSNSGFYGAEAGLNLRANTLRQKFLNYQQPSGTSPESATACFESGANKGTGDFQCDKMELAAGNKGRSKNSVTTYVVSADQGVQGVVPQGDLFQGLSMLEFTHSIYSLAFKDSNQTSDEGKQATAILQMDLKSRTVPMFQFAAFYDADLEILPGPTMTLNGPVHTNGDLYLGGDNSLNLRGQVSTVKDIFNKRKNNNATYPDGRVRIANSGGSLLNLLLNATGSTSPTTAAMDPDKILPKWGSQVKVRTEAPVSIPKADILNKEGDYYKKADIRIEYQPTPTSTALLTANSDLLKKVPFTVKAIDRTDIDNPVERTLTADQLKSLRQPIMVSADIAKIPASTPIGSGINSTYAAFHACVPTTLPVPLGLLPTDTTPDPSSPIKTWWISLTLAQRNSFIIWWNDLSTAQRNAFRLVAQDYLQRQIQSRNVPVRFSFLSQTMTAINTDNIHSNSVSDTFAPSTAPTTFSNDTRLTAQFTTSVLRETAWTNLLLMTPQQIAGLPEFDTVTGAKDGTARCFVSAPITDIGRGNLANNNVPTNHKSFTRFRNDREGRDMRILQLNIQSLALWNDHGVYLSGGNLTPTKELLYKQAPVDALAPENSFQRLGLAAKDVSEAGMVIHATIDGNTYPLAKGITSPYGFALTNGKQLLGLSKTNNNLDPTGLTVATDQGLYVQGDYNVGPRDYHTGFAAILNTPTPEANAKDRVHNKQPAAFLADTFYPLSNACLNSDRSINHLPNSGCDIGTGDLISGITAANHKILPSHTEQNAAILAGTGITTSTAYNGGLENYPRFLENWSSKEWRYKGSFVSVDTPKYATSVSPGGYSPPLRPWDYDTDFNDTRNLPPLTPQFVYIKQDSFIRSFDQ
jgi:hypothetical protein